MNTYSKRLADKMKLVFPSETEAFFAARQQKTAATGASLGLWADVERELRKDVTPETVKNYIATAALLNFEVLVELHEGLVAEAMILASEDQ
jgi:methyl coenzyme M reductase alpha subunit